MLGEAEIIAIFSIDFKSLRPWNKNGWYGAIFAGTFKLGQEGRLELVQLFDISKNAISLFNR